MGSLDQGSSCTRKPPERSTRERKPVMFGDYAEDPIELISGNEEDDTDYDSENVTKFSDPEYEFDSIRAKQPKKLSIVWKRKPTDTVAHTSAQKKTKTHQSSQCSAEPCVKKRNRVRELGRQLKRVRIERTHLKEQERKLLDKNVRLKNTISNNSQEYQHALREKDVKFMLAEQEWQMLRKVDRYQPLPDDRIRHHFASIVDQCKNWTSEWSAQQLAKPILESETAILFEEIPRNSVNRSQLVVEYLHRNPYAAPRILLLAILTRYLFSTFLRNPFQLIAVFEPLLKNETRSTLCSVYDILQEDNVASACRWRSETLRSFPRYFEAANNFPKVPVGAQGEALDRAVEAHISAFFNKSRASLLRDSTIEEDIFRLGSLKIIFKSIALFSMNLWCQKLDVDALNTSQLYEERFSRTSKLFQPHASLGLDEDDQHLDGHIINFVVVPSVQATGDAEGNNFEFSKIWSKAVVLVFDEASIHVRDGLNVKNVIRGELAGKSGTQTPKTSNVYRKVEIPDVSHEDETASCTTKSGLQSSIKEEEPVSPPLADPMESITSSATFPHPKDEVASERHSKSTEKTVNQTDKNTWVKSVDDTRNSQVRQKEE